MLGVKICTHCWWGRRKKNKKGGSDLSSEAPGNCLDYWSQHRWVSSAVLVCLTVWTCFRQLATRRSANTHRCSGGTSSSPGGTEQPPAPPPLQSLWNMEKDFEEVFKEPARRLTLYKYSAKQAASSESLYMNLSWITPILKGQWKREATDSDKGLKRLQRYKGVTDLQTLTGYLETWMLFSYLSTLSTN